MFKVRSTSTPSYLRRLIQDREHGHNLRSTTTTLCQPFTMATFAKGAFRCSAPAVWNSLPKTVLNSDSVAVFKSSLKTNAAIIRVCVQRSTAAGNPTLLAFAAVRRTALDMDRKAADAPGSSRSTISPPPAVPRSPQQQTRRTLLQLYIDGTLRQTDGRTD